MRILIFLLFLLPLSLIGQVESQFNGTLNVFSGSRIGSTNTFTISGIFNSTTTSYTSSQSDTGDIVQVQSGTRFYWLHIYSIASNSGGVITCNVRDSSSTLTVFPTGKWSLFRPTPNLRLPLSPDGETNASRSSTFNTLALRVDNLQTSVASATNCEQTFTKNSHGFRPWTPIYWTGATYARPTNDTIVPDYIVVDSLTANTFTVANCGTYATTLADGLYWYTSASPGYSLTQDTVKVPLFQVIDSTLFFQPFVGFNLMAAGADTLYLKQLSGTTALVNGDTIDISTYLLHSDTASMLDPYISLAGWGLSKLTAHTLEADTSRLATRYYSSTLPTSITANYAAISNGANLVARNIFDNNTYAGVISRPWKFGEYTTAGLPTGVTGYTLYNTTTNGLAWYQGSRWAYGLESTFNRGTSTYVPFFDANGQLTQQSTFNYTPATNLLTITDGYGQYNPTITRYQQVINRRATTGGANAGLYVNSIQSISGLSGFVSGVRVDIGASSGGTSAIPMLAYSANFNIGNSSPSYWAGFSHTGNIWNGGTLSNPIRSFSADVTYNIAVGNTMDSHSGLYTSFTTQSTGTITNVYGVQIAPQTGNITNNWGVYQSGSLERNVFRGKTSFGSTTVPVYDLDGSGSTNAFGLPRGTVAERPIIIASTTPFRYNTDSTALEYGESVGTWRQVASRAYVQSVFSAVPTSNIYTANGTLTGNRTITGVNQSLTLDNVSEFNLVSGGVTPASTIISDIFWSQTQYYNQAKTGFFKKYHSTDTRTATADGNPNFIDIFEVNLGGITGFEWGNSTSLDTVNTIFNYKYGGRYAAGFLKFIGNRPTTGTVNRLVPIFDFNQSLAGNGVAWSPMLTLRAQTDTLFQIKKNGILEAKHYGTLNNTAAALSKTGTNINATFATDGTILEIERKRDTTVYIDDADYDWSAAITTAQIASRFNRVIFWMTTTAAAGSDSELTLHTPDANLMQVEYLIHSVDEPAGFDNKIVFGTNNAVDSTNGLVTNYYPAAGDGIHIRAGLRSGVYKYRYSN